MKIEIDIDLESIIVEALKKKQIADIYVPPVEVRIPEEKNIERSRPLLQVVDIILLKKEL